MSDKPLPKLVGIKVTVEYEYEGFLRPSNPKQEVVWEGDTTRVRNTYYADPDQWVFAESCDVYARVDDEGNVVKMTPDPQSHVVMAFPATLEKDPVFDREGLALVPDTSGTAHHVKALYHRVVQASEEWHAQQMKTKAN